jgi:hypothetical protein
MEELLAEKNRTGRFCYGDSPTMANICLVTQVTASANFEGDAAFRPLAKWTPGNAKLTELKEIVDATTHYLVNLDLWRRRWRLLRISGWLLWWGRI